MLRIIYTHAHTHTPTHTHTDADTHTYTRTHTHIHVHVHAYTHTHTHAGTYTHTHTQIHTKYHDGANVAMSSNAEDLLPDIDNKCFAISSCERKRVTETAQGGGVSDKDLIIAQHKTVLTYTYIHKYTQK